MEWIVGALMLVIVVAAVGGLWLLGRFKSGGEVTQAGAPETVAAPDKWRGPVPSVVAERFLAAKSHEDRLAWVRNPEEVGPAMKAFFESGPGATEQSDGLNLVRSSSSGDLLFEAFSVEIVDRPPRLLKVTVDPRGAKVDFECYSRHGSVAWEDLLSGKVAEASEVRVILKRSGYYLHEFGDEQRWLNLQATSPDVPEALELYLDRKHPKVAEIEKLGDTAFHATISIRAVNGSEKRRQFEISGVKALDWVEPD